MKINVSDIKADAQELAYDEPTDELNPLLEHGTVRDFDFPAPMRVRLVHYRAGQELFFSGSLGGPAIGHCARCLEDFVLDVSRDFAFVLVPRRGDKAETALVDDDPDLSFYSSEEVDLSPLVREQILLALPTRPLCDENCRGLCPQCGANRNLAPCSCAAPAGDPRLAVLAGLKSSGQ